MSGREDSETYTNMQKLCCEWSIIPVSDKIKFIIINNAKQLKPQAETIMLKSFIEGTVTSTAHIYPVFNLRFGEYGGRSV